MEIIARQMENYRAINEKRSRDKWETFRSHVTGCHARYFRGQDDNAAIVGKFFFNLVIYKPAI